MNNFNDINLFVLYDFVLERLISRSFAFSCESNVIFFSFIDAPNFIERKINMKLKLM